MGEPIEKRQRGAARLDASPVLPLEGISRRRLFAAGATVGAGLAIPGLVVALAPRAGAAESAPSGAMCMSERAADTAGVMRVPFTAGAPLAEPEVRRSVNGLLQTTLRAQYAYRNVGGYRLHLRSYDGGTPAPTLRMRAGEVLRIRLTNDLPPNRDPMPVYQAQPHHLNTTNFHFHGGHVSPGGISDNVLRTMEPGGSYDVEITLPADHPAGTYWYHPHNHGSADVQLASGMVGAIIIDGDFDKVPEIAAARDRLLVLGEAVFDAFGTIEDFDTLFPETATRFFTVNGQREPAITMQPGEVQRWRLLHAGYQDDMFLQLEGHTLHPIARDGIALAAIDRGTMHFPGHEKDDPTGMLIVPGQRIDVLVRAGAPGTYQLRALPYDQGYPSPTGPIARVVVDGAPKPMNLPATLPPPPLAPIRDEEITGRRQIVFSAEHPEADAAGHWQEFTFLVDERTFDMNRVDQRIKLGSVEEWTIVNHHEHDHIFHIHVNPFQVIKVNGQPVAEPVWLDTAVLPRNGTLTLRSRFLDFAGRFVFHCHMMNHEELGMMQVVEVYA